MPISGCSARRPSERRDSPASRHPTSGRPGLRTDAASRSRPSAAPRTDIYVKTLDVLEEEKVLWHNESDKLVEDWSADGRALSVTVLRSGLWSYPVDPTQKPTLIRPSLTAETWQSEFSPDGRWLAYVSLEFGRSEVYVEPVPATGARWQVSANGGAEPHWSKDSGELFYLTLDQWIAAITVPTTDTWNLTATSRLFKATIPETVGGSDYAVGPSGDFVVNTPAGRPGHSAH